jgi:hypothetical protein
MPPYNPYLEAANATEGLGQSLSSLFVNLERMRMQQAQQESELGLQQRHANVWDAQAELARGRAALEAEKLLKEKLIRESAISSGEEEAKRVGGTPEDQAATKSLYTLAGTYGPAVAARVTQILSPGQTWPHPVTGQPIAKGQPPAADKMMSVGGDNVFDPVTKTWYQAPMKPGGQLADVAKALGVINPVVTSQSQIVNNANDSVLGPNEYVLGQDYYSNTLRNLPRNQKIQSGFMDLFQTILESMQTNNQPPVAFGTPPPMTGVTNAVPMIQTSKGNKYRVVPIQ